MRTTGYIQWLNQNSLRAYPLSEISTRRDNSGQTFPDDTILDIAIIAEEPAESVYLSSVSFTDKTISVAISETINGLSSVVYIGTFLKSNIIPYTTYSLVSVKSFGCATIVFGNINYSNQKYLFSSAPQSMFEWKCITLAKTLPITSITKLNGGPDDIVSGIITLLPGSNITLEKRGAYRILTDEPFCGIYIESSVYNNESNIANSLVMLPIYYHERFFSDEEYRYILMYSGTGQDPNTAKWKILYIENSIVDWKSAPILATMTSGLHPIHGEWDKTMSVESSNVIFVASDKDTTLQFLGPCDNLDPSSICGGYPLRSINDAHGDEEYKITLKVDLPTVKRQL